MSLFGSVTSMVATALVYLMRGDELPLSPDGKPVKQNILYEMAIDELSEFYNDSIYLSQLRYLCINYADELTLCFNVMFYVLVALFCKRLWNYFWRLVKFISS